MKRSEIKQHIIQTASDLFYQNGYNLTGVNEIVKEAGVAKATLYNHFESKDSICLAFLDNKHQAFLNSISLYIAEVKPGNKKLIAIFDFLELFFNNPEFNGCWCVNTISELPKDDTLIRLKIQEQKHQFLAFIENLVKENTEHSTEKEQKTLAKQIYLLYEGAVSESYLHQAVWPIVSAKEMCIKILR